MRVFMSREITLPDGLLEIVSGRFSIRDYTLEKPTLVFLYGPEECSSCAIEKMIEHSLDMDALQESGKCTVLVLFSPEEGNQYDVLNQLLNIELPFPTYLDMEGNFNNLNENFPSDIRFHCFLLGMDGHPIFIGNPLHSPALHNLLEKTLNTIVE